MTQTWKSKCHSPTLSQTSRSIILQLIVSFKRLLSLGDIKGAFLEADVTKQTQEKPVFAEFPPRGVPGIPRGSLVQVLGNIYGSNDVPHNWYVEFDKVAQQAGFTKSKLDSCLYFCHGESGDLQGVLDAHVDDNITGGCGFLSESGVKDKGNSSVRFTLNIPMVRSPFSKRNMSNTSDQSAFPKSK